MSLDLRWVVDVWDWAENELDKRNDRLKTLAVLEKEDRSILRRVP